MPAGLPLLFLFLDSGAASEAPVLQVFFSPPLAFYQGFPLAFYQGFPLSNSLSNPPPNPNHPNPNPNHPMRTGPMRAGPNPRTATPNPCHPKRTSLWHKGYMWPFEQGWILALLPRAKLKKHCPVGGAAGANTKARLEQGRISRLEPKNNRHKHSDQVASH